ncbi:MAG: aminoacyl-tRNA hydrolase [Longimicrobiales bacterium]
MTTAAKKVVVGLGNPGPEYDATRHNVGWWVLDRFAYDHDFEAFHRDGKAWVSDGVVGGVAFRLMKPRTFMNRSGQALTKLWELSGFEASDDLLVVSDDANLDIGRVRFRPSGGAGGHNGLKSITQALGTDQYARLRIGVGLCPAGVDLADWVLEPVPGEEEEQLVSLLPELSRAILVWAEEGPEHAMNSANR